MRGIALIALLLAGCGGSGSSSASPGTVVPRSLDQSSLDPAPYTPTPGSTTIAGGPQALALEGGRDRAAALALRFVAAVVELDRGRIEAMLADPLLRTRGRIGRTTFTRAQTLRGLNNRRSTRAGVAAVAIEDIVDMANIRAEPLSAPNPLVQSGDYIVTVRITNPQAQQRLRARLGWGGEGRLIVRLADPQPIRGH